MPEFFNFLDKDILTSIFEEKGFIVEQSNYVNRDDFPESLRLDGRESVMLIARKPSHLISSK